MSSSHVQVYVYIQPNLSCSINKIDDGFCSAGGKSLLKVFMGILLGIQPIVRLRSSENNMYTCIVHVCCILVLYTCTVHLCCTLVLYTCTVHLCLHLYCTLVFTLVLYTCAVHLYCILVL